MGVEVIWVTDPTGTPQTVLIVGEVVNTRGVTIIHRLICSSVGSQTSLREVSAAPVMVGETVSRDGETHEATISATEDDAFPWTLVVAALVLLSLVAAGGAYRRFG